MIFLSLILVTFVLSLSARAMEDATLVISNKPCTYSELQESLDTPTNKENLRNTFFPENKAPPLQVIVSYTLSNKSGDVYAWIWTPMYLIVGARYLAETGLGIPVISLIKRFKPDLLDQIPFIKVGSVNINLELACQPDPLNCEDKNQCNIEKLTSLLREYAHEGNFTLVHFSSAAYSSKYNSRREMLIQQYFDYIFKVTLSAAVVYTVFLSMIILPLMYHLIKDYFAKLNEWLLNTNYPFYEVFWGSIIVLFLCNVYYTVIDCFLLGSEITWVKLVIDKIYIFYGLWLSFLFLGQLVTSLLIPKSTALPTPRFLTVFLKTCCFKFNDTKINSAIQTVAIWIVLLFIHYHSTNALFVVACIVADPVTASTWLLSSLFLKIAGACIFGGLFAFDRAWIKDETLRLTHQGAMRQTLYVVSWSLPFIGGCLLSAGLCGLTFMDKDTQPKFVSSIASFLLAPPAFVFLGWLLRYFVKKLFMMVSPGSGRTEEDRDDDSYTIISSDEEETEDIHIENEDLQ